jgi:hypothetical protein
MIQVQIEDNNISGIEFLQVVSEDEDELSFWINNFKKMWEGYSPSVTKPNWNCEANKWVCTASRWTSCD